MISVVNKHWHVPGNHDIYIGRGSPLGNKWSHMKNTKAEHKVASREIAIEKYEEWISEASESDVAVKQVLNYVVDAELRGEDINLVCYCKPAACHGDVLKKLLDQIVENRKYV
jgi:hypothetical protein